MLRKEEMHKAAAAPAEESNQNDYPIKRKTYIFAVDNLSEKSCEWGAIY